jgi:hypothetical protein
MTFKVDGAADFTATSSFYFKYTDMMGNVFTTDRYTLVAAQTAATFNANVATLLKTLPNKVFDDVTVGLTAMTVVLADDLVFTVTFTSEFTTGTQALEIMIDGCNMAGCQPKGKGMVQVAPTFATDAWPMKCVTPTGATCAPKTPADADATTHPTMTGKVTTLPADVTCPLVLKKLKDLVTANIDPPVYGTGMDAWAWKWCDDATGTWTAIADITVTTNVLTTSSDGYTDDTYTMEVPTGTGVAVAVTLDMTGYALDSIPIGTKLLFYPIMVTDDADATLTVDAEYVGGDVNKMYTITATSGTEFTWTRDGMLEEVTKAAAAMTMDNSLAVTVGSLDSGNTLYFWPSRAVASSTTTTAAVQERSVCSSRGLCNQETGICECFEGYRGESCSSQTILV